MLHVSAEPLAYKAKISSHDSAGNFKPVWECEHKHAEYAETIECGEKYLQDKLGAKANGKS